MPVTEPVQAISIPDEHDHGARPEVGQGLTALAEPELTGEVMRAVVDAAPDALLIMDDRGLIQLVNSRAEALFGYHRGELLGREVETLIPARFRGVHTANRLRYRASPTVRAMGSGLSLYGLRARGLRRLRLPRRGVVWLVGPLHH